MDCSPPGSSVPKDSPDKNTGVGFHALLQRIFPTQGSNPCLVHCRWILYHLSYQGSPRILEWVAYPFSSGSSWPKSQTGVSCIAGSFFTSWVTREVQHSIEAIKYYVGSCWFYDFIVYRWCNYVRKNSVCICTENNLDRYALRYLCCLSLMNGIIDVDVHLCISIFLLFINDYALLYNKNKINQI